MWKLDWVKIGWKRIRKVVSGHPETSGAVGSWISFVISTEEKSHNSYNMINKIKFIFETKMYLISIFPLLFLIFIDNVAHYGYNKTVGWAFDITGISFFIPYFLLTFFIGFSLLAIIKTKTNFILSILFLLGISYCCLFQSDYSNIDLIDNLLLISTSLFLLIFINSIYLKFKSQK